MSRSSEYPLVDDPLLYHRSSVSWRQPVVQAQAGDVLKIGCVVGHKGEVVHQGDGGNHQVRNGNGNSLLQQPTLQFAELLRTCRVEIKNGNFLEQVIDEAQQLGRV